VGQEEEEVIWETTDPKMRLFFFSRLMTRWTLGYKSQDQNAERGDKVEDRDST